MLRVISTLFVESSARSALSAVASECPRPHCQTLGRSPSSVEQRNSYTYAYFTRSRDQGIRRRARGWRSRRRRRAGGRLGAWPLPPRLGIDLWEHLVEELKLEDAVAVPAHQPLAHLVPVHPPPRPLAGLGGEDLADAEALGAVPPLAHAKEERVVVPVCAGRECNKEGGRERRERGEKGRG